MEDTEEKLQPQVEDALADGPPTTTPTNLPTKQPTAEPTHSPSESPTEFSCDDGDSEFRINLQTDAYPDETAIATFSLNETFTGLDSLESFEASFSPEYLNIEIPLCLETDQCYVFAITDSAGDGLTFFGGYYDLYLEDKKIFRGDGIFRNYDSRVFCTGDVCQDDTEIRFSKDKLSCSKYIKGDFSEKKMKCTRTVNGKKVFEYCPQTCGKRAKKGSCSWMYKLEQELEPLVLDAMPTVSPTHDPTKTPTRMPTAEPTYGYSINPTKMPTAEPTKPPTKEPTLNPTKPPTENPTMQPTQAPTGAPTAHPTHEPTNSF